MSLSCPKADAISLTSPAFNQVKMAYNASKEEKLDKLQELRDAREAKYKVETS